VRLGGGRAERDARRALEDALDPIEDAHLDAKEVYPAAVEAHHAAAAAYRQAVAAAGAAAYDAPAVAAAARELAAAADARAEAKEAKVQAAGRYEATRTWLRREAEIVTLQTRTIPDLTRKLAAPILTKDGEDGARDDREERARLEQLLVAARQELAALVEEVLPLRRALEELGGQVVGPPVPPDLPPGSAEVTTHTIDVSAAVNRRRDTKGGN
jgi:hypothetical protein